MHRIQAFFLALLLFAYGCAGAAPLPPQAVELNRAGVAALEDGDLESADARFSLALEYNPSFVEALTNQGLVELQRGNFERARRLLTRAERLNPDVAQPHHGLGMLAERERRPDLASDHYYAALRVDPGFVPARANLARLLFDAGLYEDALVEFKRLSEVAPDEAVGASGLATTLLRLGRADEAQLVLKRALDRFPNDWTLTILKARFELRRGDFAAAVSLLTPLAFERSDSAVAALSWLATAELARGRTREAVSAAQRALELAPEEPVAAAALGMALTELKDPSAGAWVERAQALAARAPRIARARSKD